MYQRDKLIPHSVPSMPNGRRVSLSYDVRRRICCRVSTTSLGGDLHQHGGMTYVLEKFFPVIICGNRRPRVGSCVSEERSPRACTRGVAEIVGTIKIGARRLWMRYLDSREEREARPPWMRGKPV